MILNAMSLRYRCSLFLILSEGEKSNILPLNGKKYDFHHSEHWKKDRDIKKDMDNIPK